MNDLPHENDDGDSHEPAAPHGKLYVAGMIERDDSQLIIVQRKARHGSESLWSFPRGTVGAGESPEAAMRRIARELLGIEVEIVVGQPPLLADLGGRPVEFRYFFCGIVLGTPDAKAYSEIRWVLRGQLCEYDFEPSVQPVVEWLMGS